MSLNCLRQRWVLWLMWACLLVVQSSVSWAGAESQALPTQEVQLASEVFTKGGPIPSWVEPVDIPDTTKTSPVVLRLADTQIQVDPVVAHHVNRAIQVNDSGALGQIGQYAIEFVPQYQRVTLHRLKLLRGKETIDVLDKATVRFIQRESGLESGVFSGAVTALILIPDVRVGDTLHVSYTEQGRNPVLGNTYADAASWDQPEPVELRRVVLHYPAKRAIAWKMAGDVPGAAVAPSIADKGGVRTLTFVGRDMPASEPEPFVPPGYLPYRYLQFSEWSNWSAVAQWANDLFPPVTPQAGPVRALMADLKRLPRDEDRVAAALQWVQSEVRYFSVALGESSHRPHAPDEVVEKRFGDCKDKTYLLLSILRELKIDAHPVLLSLGARDGIHKLLPAPDVFDHVILRASLPSGVFYLDGTRQRQSGSLLKMGLGLEGADGLLVDPKTQALLTISGAQARANSLNELTETINIAELKGPATIEVKQVWHGGAAEAVRAFMAQSSPEQQRKFALAGYERRYPGVELEKAPVFADDKLSNQVSMDAAYKVPAMLAEAGGEWGLRYFPSNMQGVFNIPENISRKHPVALFNQPYDARYQLTVNWPDNVHVIRDPSAQKVLSVAFDADVATAFRGNKAQQVIEFHTKRGELTPPELPVFLEDLRKMEKAINGVVYVERDAIAVPGQAVPQPTLATLQDTIQSRLTQRLGKLTKTIESGRLNDEDQASALCDRAETLSDLGRLDEGMADAQLAMAKAPQSPRPWACRANLWFAKGQFAQAVNDHGKALALGYDEFETYYHRGVARFYLGKLQEAAGDFSQAVKSASNDSARRYAMLWWTWTVKRTGAGKLPSSIEGAEPTPGGVWPWPAQALLLGRQSEEQVLAFVNTKSGDDRQLALAEAWFYIGQNQLLRGRADLAKDSFEKVRQQGVTVYLEHVAAGFELQRIQAAAR